MKTLPTLSLSLAVLFSSCAGDQEPIKPYASRLGKITSFIQNGMTDGLTDPEIGS